MRAVVLDRPGGPEQLAIRDVPRPAPGAGELRVKVAASGANRVEAKIRLDPSRRGVVLPAILGYEAAGVVDAVGPGVDRARIGERVYYAADFLNTSQGTHAEFHTVRAEIVAPAPAGLSLIEAASIPLGGGTAWEAIVRRLNVRPGETVLIYGASGSVGTFAVQFARLAGAAVLAVASRENLDFLRELGADTVLDYARDDPVQAALDRTGGRGVDAVLDAFGEGTLEAAVRGVRPFGRLATIVGFRGDFSKLYTRNLTVHGILLTRERARLEEMRRLLESGRVRFPITSYPMEAVRAVHERLDSGHARGKMVLTIEPPS